MRTLLHSRIGAAILFAFILSIGNLVAQPCSDAGTPAASLDTICDGGTTNLTLTGYIGAIQWQSFDGSVWNDETGTGSNTDNYLVAPTTTTDYRAVVTDAGCDPDTSVTLTIQVGPGTPSANGVSRCGYGPVTLSATGVGIRWYDDPTGGNFLGAGSNYTTNVGNSTVFYAAASLGGGSGGVTPMPAQSNFFNNNARGYFFTSPVDMTITGLYVPSTNTGAQNIAVMKFDNNLPPPVYSATTNAFQTLFLTQLNPSTGVIPVSIQVQTGDVIGVLATRDVTDYNSYAPGNSSTVIDGIIVPLERMGMQFPLTTNVPHDIWQEVGGNISRLEIHYQVGCESPRIAVPVTVTAPTAINLSWTAQAICQGESTQLTVSSSNSAYAYTWSPSAGLNTTTGDTVLATPGTSTTYAVVADDGTCGAIDSVTISVFPASAAGVATITTDTICTGNNATLYLSSYNGTIQWQEDNGSGWINSSGPGNNQDQFLVSPTLNTLYRAIVTNGACASDTSATLSLDVLSITAPMVVGDSICGPGTANLSASGSGLLNWYSGPTGGSIINTGPAYSPNVSTTTTYYVEAASGVPIELGQPAVLPGAVVVGGNDWGLQFDVIDPSTLESVDLYVGTTSGPVTINMRSVMNGAILNSYTTNVTAGASPATIPLGFTLNPGTGYRLELASGSVNCKYTSYGGVYPYTLPGAPLTITGYINPNYSAGVFYYFFYNWRVSVGCNSNRVPVVAEVLPIPPTPTIAPLWNTLTSSSPTGNQWYLNGSPIAGATGQVHIATQAGTYTVVVTNAFGCTSVSQPVFTTSIDELESIGLTMYPNPFSDEFNIEFKSLDAKGAELILYDLVGNKVKVMTLHNNKTVIPTADLAPGIYNAEVTGNGTTVRYKLLRQ